MKKVAHGELFRQIDIEEQKREKLGKDLNGRQIAWMVDQFFKIGDMDTRILDINDFHQVVLRGENLRDFIYSWESTLIQINPTHVPNDETKE